MQVVVARQPIRVCPSAPMFQKRILNAGVTAKEIPSKTATFWHGDPDLAGGAEGALEDRAIDG